MNRIEKNNKIMVGKPVIRGTRITVEYILELLDQGWNVEDIVKEHPRLTEEDVKAVISFLRKSLPIKIRARDEIIVR